MIREICNFIRAIHWRLFLKQYWWLIGLGLWIGASLSLDPFIKTGIFFEKDEYQTLKKFFAYPYFLTFAIIVFPPLLIIVYDKLKTLTRLQWDLFLLFGLICTAFINFWGWIHFHMTFLLIAIGITIFIIRGALVGRYDFIRLPIDKYLIGLVFIMMLSSFGPLGLGGGTFSYTSKFFIGMVLPIFFIHNVVRTKKQLMKCIQWMIYLAIFSSILGIGQFLLFKFFGISMSGNWTGGIGRVSSLPVLGDVLRVAGLTGNPNYLAFSTGTMTIMMIRMLLKPTYFSKKWKTIFIIGIIMGLSCSVFTVSRGSWMALAICFALIPFIAFPDRKTTILLCYFLIFAIGYLSGLFEYLYEMVYSIRSSAISFREHLDSLGWNVIFTYPLTGVGFGMFEDYWNFYDSTVHNLWLNFASQVGVLGAFVLIVYLLSVSFRLIRAIHSVTGFNKLILQSFLIGIIFFLPQASVRPQIWDKFYWFYFGFIETAIYVLGRPGVKSKIYYPIFGYSWMDEPTIQVEGRR